MDLLKEIKEAERANMRLADKLLICILAFLVVCMVYVFIIKKPANTNANGLPISDATSTFSVERWADEQAAVACWVLETKDKTPVSLSCQTFKDVKASIEDMKAFQASQAKLPSVTSSHE